MIPEMEMHQIGEALELAPYSTFLDARARKVASEIGLKCGISPYFRPAKDRPSAWFWHRTGTTFVAIQDGKRRAYTVGVLQFSLYAPATSGEDTSEIGARLVEAFDGKEWEVPTSGRIIMGKVMHQPLNFTVRGWDVRIVDGSFNIVRSF